MNFELHPVGLEEANNMFAENYKLIQHIECSPEFVIELKDPMSRTCIFCAKSYPDVAFGNIAHLVPKSLGNIHIISDFECDECNAKFSRYESDLARFLSMQRTICKTKSGPQKVAKFTSDREQVMVSHLSKSDTTFLKISKQQNPNNPISFDEISNQFKIEFKTKKYRPLYVYKALLKIALSVMPADRLQNYTHALKFLVTSSYDHVPQLVFPVDWNVMPWGIKFEPVSIYLYEKIESQSIIPTHVVAVYAGGSVFQYHIPCYNDDILNLQGKRPSFIFPPVISPDTGVDRQKVHRLSWVPSSLEPEMRTDIVTFGGDPITSYMFATGELTSEKMDLEKVWAVLFEKDGIYVAQGH